MIVKSSITCVYALLLFPLPDDKLEDPSYLLLSIP